jgi:eukaryotic-like serine/threonine-protein kinase
MPAPTTVDEFVDLVRKSAVLDEPRLSAHVQKLKADPSTPKDLSGIAGLFVRDGLLTYFQAEQFLQGRWKRFTIGKYKVLEKLGSGGMGQVFLCEHKLMRRRVAVKVLPTAKAADPSSLDRFYREARAVAALDHQNIVRAYDIDQDENLHFLVMEYVDGSSLQDMIRKGGKMDVTRACHYVYWSAIGLQHAHVSGLYHRDIKPGNILVDRTGVVKILDLGLARFFNDDQDLLTKKYDESVLGTADYLAPEQAIDSHTVDGRADIYSLGATFYFLLTGNPPFAEGSVAQKLLWHQTRTPKPVREVRPEVPAAVAAILEKMMAKKPEDRYPTPDKLAEALLPFTQTPIPPPPDEEMPLLSVAAQGTASGPVSVSASPRTVVTTPRTPPPSHESKAPPLPPKPTPGPAPAAKPASTGGSKVAVAEADTQRNKPVPVVEPIPDSAPGAQIWEAISADTANAAHADTDRRRRDAKSSRRVKTKTDTMKAEVKSSAPKSSRRRGQTPRVSKRTLLLIAVGAIIIGGGAVAVYWFGFRDKSPRGTTSSGLEPRTLVLTKNPGGAALHYTSLESALKDYHPGDKIIIRDEVWEEFGAATRTKDLQISAADGKRVIWRAPANRRGGALLSLAGTEGAKISGITFQAGGQADYDVRLFGQCPGLVLEDVEMLDAGVANLAVADCVGPIIIRKCRFANPIGKECRAAVLFVADPPSKGSQNVQFNGCCAEGPYSSAAFQFEANATGIEIHHCRAGNAANGVLFRKLLPPAEPNWQVKIVGNTFQATQGAGINCEDPAELAKRPQNRIIVERNYFLGEPARVGVDPNAKFLTAEGNFRKTGTPPGPSPQFPTTEINIDLPSDPAKFLQYDKSSPLFRAYKDQPVGAPPE